MHGVTKAAVCLAALAVSQAWGALPPEPGANGSLASQAFFKPELALVSGQVPLSQALRKPGTDKARHWEDFFARHGRDFEVHIDAVTGTAANIQGAVPLIPGTGVGNQRTLEGVGRQLGRAVVEVDDAVVADLVYRFIDANQKVLGVDLAQLGDIRADPITPDLWQVSIPQRYQGIPVRHGRIAASISHGNLVVVGTEAWSNVAISPLPLVDADRAMMLAHERFGLLASPDEVWLGPLLEVVPVARPGRGLGEGMGHRLVWTYGFRLQGEHARWKVTVDASSGEVLALEDDNHYAGRAILGDVFVYTNTGLPAACQPGSRCGSTQLRYPMPWANYSPTGFANAFGVFGPSAELPTTTLAGQYLRVQDACAINIGAVDGVDIDVGYRYQEPCLNLAYKSASPAARTAYYELGRIQELARGWLPNNTWLKSQVVANVNINGTCNAFWNGTSLNFYRAGGGCRNMGEIGAMLDHEWGHGLDDNDSNGALSNPSEAYGDIAAIYRQPFHPLATPGNGVPSPASCIGYGLTMSSGPCLMTADGTGYNVNEAQVGAAWCTTQCSGVRDADYAAHVVQTPSTPQNFVCPRCVSGTGPCGRSVHCAASPVRQAAWDFIARDLQAPPFNLDWNTAQNIGNRVFYLGSGNVGTWHSCNCTAGTADGCAATHGYKQWLVADDDNGNLNDGTPHMTAIYNAFNRHGIACATPSPINSGCAGAPTAKPSVTVTAGTGQIALSWAPVPGATQYWVMRSDGLNACTYGKARIATVATTTFTDTEVRGGHRTCYSVVPVGSSQSCFGPSSTCDDATNVGCAVPL
ncbi:hypothetical protein NVS55_20435 [Myxococcus stipitatus]|uniref:hypothetical protein n=1 Tax=Myxococcus stipitatus TaxID=83455 RepID=UPI0031453176